jgi:prophage regulatory protein
MARLLRFKELRPRGVPYTRQHVGRLEKVDEFPRRVQLSPNTVAWVDTEIDEWVEAKIVARDRAVVDTLLEQRSAQSEIAPAVRKRQARLSSD